MSVQAKFFKEHGESICVCVLICKGDCYFLSIKIKSLQTRKQGTNTLGGGDGQAGLACCSSWGCKESDTTERLNWAEAYSSFHPSLLLLCHGYIKGSSTLGWGGASGLRSWWNACLDYGLTRTGGRKPETGGVSASVTQPRPDRQLWLPMACLPTKETQLQKFSSFITFLIYFSPYVFLHPYVDTVCISRDKRTHSCFPFCFSWGIQFFPSLGSQLTLSTLSCQYSVPRELDLFSVFFWLNRACKKSWSVDFVLFLSLPRKWRGQVGWWEGEY